VSAASVSVGLGAPAVVKQEVVQAHVDRFPKDGSKGRPERVIEDIMKNGSIDFHKVFEAFWRRESIYGFGDIQLKQLYDKVKQTYFNSIR
jgi:hypothetical protein